MAIYERSSRTKVFGWNLEEGLSARGAGVTMPWPGSAFLVRPAPPVLCSPSPNCANAFRHPLVSHIAVSPRLEAMLKIRDGI
jgi:hypothetical protein